MKQIGALTLLCLICMPAFAQLTTKNNQVVYNCPVGATENASDPSTYCDEETQIVKDALVGLELARTTHSCLKTPQGTLEGGGQCRGYVRYKKSATDQLTKRIFSDRFQANQISRFVSAEIYFVRQPNGKYTTYADNISDGILKIDRFIEGNTNINVTFDRDGRPNWTSISYKVGTNDVTFITDFITKAEYTDLINRDPEGHITGTKRYYVTNPPESNE